MKNQLINYNRKTGNNTKLSKQWQEKEKNSDTTQIQLRYM